jgi:hypothetical protein
MAMADDDDKVVAFPKTVEERKALIKAKQAIEQRRLVNLFVDEAGSGALFTTGDGVAYADQIANGHRETWPIRSKQFRHAYIQYVTRQAEQLSEANPLMAMIMGGSLVRRQHRDRRFRDEGDRRPPDPRGPRAGRRGGRRHLH